MRGPPPHPFHAFHGPHGYSHGPPGPRGQQPPPQHGPPPPPPPHARHLGPTASAPYAGNGPSMPHGAPLPPHASRLASAPFGAAPQAASAGPPGGEAAAKEHSVSGANHGYGFLRGAARPAGDAASPKREGPRPLTGTPTAAAALQPQPSPGGVLATPGPQGGAPGANLRAASAVHGAMWAQPSPGPPPAGVHAVPRSASGVEAAAGGPGLAGARGRGQQQQQQRGEAFLRDLWKRLGLTVTREQLTTAVSAHGGSVALYIEGIVRRLGTLRSEYADAPVEALDREIAMLKQCLDVLREGGAATLPYMPLLRALLTEQERVIGAFSQARLLPTTNKSARAVRDDIARWATVRDSAVTIHQILGSYTREIELHMQLEKAVSEQVRAAEQKVREFADMASAAAPAEEEAKRLLREVRERNLALEAACRGDSNKLGAAMNEEMQEIDGTRNPLLAEREQAHEALRINREEQVAKVQQIEQLRAELRELERAEGQLLDRLRSAEHQLTHDDRDRRQWTDHAGVWHEQLNKAISACNVNVQVTDYLQDVVETARGAVDERVVALKATTEAEYKRLLLDHLEAFRGLFLASGELLHRKNARRAELVRQIERTSIQLDQARATLSPDTETLARRQQSLDGDLRKLDEELAIDQTRFREARDRFTPTEKKLDELGVDYIHPITDLDNLLDNERLLEERRTQQLEVLREQDEAAAVMSLNRSRGSPTHATPIIAAQRIARLSEDEHVVVAPVAGEPSADAAAELAPDAEGESEGEGEAEAENEAEPESDEGKGANKADAVSPVNEGKGKRNRNRKR